MKVKDIIKKQTTVIAVAVILVVIATVGVSYAIFFDVKSNSSNQVITAGNLDLSVSGISALSLSAPVTNDVGLKSTPVTYTVKNNGNLPATYSIYVNLTSGSTILNNVKVSIDGNATSGSTAKTLASLGTMTESGTTYYKIKSGATLAAGATSSASYIRVWIDEDTLSGALSNVSLNMNLYIVSEVQE